MGKLTLTKNEIDDLKEELKQYGYVEDGLELYRLIADPEYKGDITLFYSIVDFTGRDDLAKRTLLKFKSTLKVLDLIHKKLGKVMPTVNFVACDTLQRHNFPDLSEEALNADLNKKRAQLADRLGIPQINGDTGPLEYKLDGETYTLNIQRWDSMLTPEIREFINTVKIKLDKAAADPNALHNFCDDSYLFSSKTGLLREEIAQLKKFITMQARVTEVAHKKLVHLGANTTLAAMQFLKHTLKERVNAEVHFETGKPDTYHAQKEAVLEHEIFQGKGLSYFKQGIVYVMEEVYALCNKYSIYIYGAGTVSMHRSHIFYTLHDLFKPGNIPVGYLASSEFNNLDEVQLEHARRNYQITLLNRSRPKSKSIQIPGTDTVDSSVSGTTTSSPVSSYGSEKDHSVTPPIVRSDRSDSLGGAGSGHSSDNDSDHSQKSSSSKGSKGSLNPIQFGMEVAKALNPDKLPLLYVDIANCYNSGTNPATAAVLSFTGGGRSGTTSPGRNNNNNTNTGTNDNNNTSANQASPPLSPKLTGN